MPCYRSAMTTIDRRGFLRGLAGSGAAFAASGAHAQEGAEAPVPAPAPLAPAPLAPASRLPQASLPTLSRETAQTTEQAISKYEGIVAGGGWPQVPPAERLHLGMRHPSVVPLRQRLTIVSDLEA